MLFSNLKPSEFIKIPRFAAKLTTEFQNKYAKDFDEIFDCLYVSFLKSFESKTLDAHFKFLLLANLWSDPINLAIITHHATPTTDRVKDLEIPVNKCFQLMTWIQSTDMIPTKISQQLQNTILSQITLTSTLTGDPETEKLLKNIKITWNNEIDNNLTVQSSLVDSQFFIPLREMYSLYITDVIKSGTTGNFSELLIELMNRAKLTFNWYGTTKDELSNRIIADVLINRTYELDHYASTDYEYIDSSSFLLSQRYDYALGSIGDFTERHIMKSKHNLLYISFWNRVDYLYKLFQYGIQNNMFKPGFDININIKEVTTHIFLLVLMCFIPNSFVVPLLALVKTIDGLNLGFYEKSKTVWVIVHGMLTIQTGDVFNLTYSTTQGRYENMQKVFEIVSQWGWQGWFCGSKTGSTQFIDKSRYVGKEIKYIPVPHMNNVISMALEDYFNLNPVSMNEFFKYFEDTYSSRRINLDGRSLPKLLIDLNKMKKHGRPYEFLSNSKAIGGAQKAMRELNLEIQVISYILRAATHLIRFEFNTEFTGDPIWGDKTDVLARLATEIHIVSPLYKGSPETFMRLADKADQLLSALKLINTTTFRIQLVKLKSGSLRILGNDVLLEFVSILEKSGDDYQLMKPESHNENINKLKRIARKWKNDFDALGLTIPVPYQLDIFVNIYTILVYAIDELKRIVTRTVTHWHTIENETNNLIDIRTSNRGYTRAMHDGRHNISIIRANLENLTFGSVKMNGVEDKMYAAALNAPFDDPTNGTLNEIIVRMMPYLKATPKGSNLSKLFDPKI